MLEKRLFEIQRKYKIKDNSLCVFLDLLLQRILKLNLTKEDIFGEFLHMNHPLYIEDYPYYNTSEGNYLIVKTSIVGIYQMLTNEYGIGWYERPISMIGEISYRCNNIL